MLDPAERAQHLSGVIGCERQRALGISDRVYVIDQGRVVHHASARELLADRAIQERYFAVWRRQASASSSQPTSQAVPPNGVIAPSDRTPVSTSR